MKSILHNIAGKCLQEKGLRFALAGFCLSLGLAACSDDKSVAGGTSEDAGIIAVTDREIVGVSQKGPFLVGSSVTIQELDGHSLTQTGNSFRASVKSDLGDFVVKGVNLVSQYALLEVNGYYRNEVTGEKSEGMIALRAVTDLSDRSHVNVNLLTHLESGRVLTLVQNAGLTFAEAKAQAEREVLAAFGIADKLERTEDLDLFTGEGGAVLIALSVLMQGDGSAADLSERVARAALSFAENGTWQGADKVEMVDWAYYVENEYFELNEQGSLLHKVRQNVESWMSGNEAPSFEAILYKFWTKEYGLDECGEGNAKEIRENTNPDSKLYRAQFVCDEWEKRWILAGRRELDASFYMSTTDKRNNVEYKVLDIGKVRWMAENLRYAFSTTNTRNKSLCYDDEKLNCEAYGMLYDYESALKACPSGSRLPNYREVENLLQQYGGAGKGAAEALMSMGYFGALLGGYSVRSTWFEWEGGAGYTGMHESTAIWISTQDYPSGKKVLWIDSTVAEVRDAPGATAYVRCVGEEFSLDETKTYDGNKYMIDPRDNSSYRYTEIAGKAWLAENVHYSGNSMSKPCSYNYGECYYTWEEAVGSDSVGGVCPEGWHLPSREEWSELLSLVAGRIEGDADYIHYYDINFKLSDLKDWYEGDYLLPDSNDVYDFTVKPVGEYQYMIDGTGSYFDSGVAAFWGSSDSVRIISDYEEFNMPSDRLEVGYMVEMDGGYSATGQWNNKRARLSVRCVRNEN